MSSLIDQLSWYVRYYQLTDTVKDKGFVSGVIVRLIRPNLVPRMVGAVADRTSVDHRVVETVEAGVIQVIVAKQHNIAGLWA